jgi:hypothetical protein
MTQTLDTAAAKRGLHGVFAATLTMEAIVVWMAIAPLAALGELPGWGIAVLGLLGAALVALAALLKRPWAYAVGTGLQVVVLLTGFFHPAMFVLGGAFGVLWLVELRMRAKLRAGTLGRRQVS